MAGSVTVTASTHGDGRRPTFPSRRQAERSDVFECPQRDVFHDSEDRKTRNVPSVLCETKKSKARSGLIGGNRSAIGGGNVLAQRVGVEAPVIVLKIPPPSLKTERLRIVAE